MIESRHINTFPVLGTSRVLQISMLLMETRSPKCCKNFGYPIRTLHGRWPTNPILDLMHNSSMARWELTRIIFISYEPIYFGPVTRRCQVVPASLYHGRISEK